MPRGRRIAHHLQKRLIGRAMPGSEPWTPPRRLRDLDDDTVEWLARLNEEERRRLIDVSHLTEKQTHRLIQFLSLDDARWEAGFKIVTRSAFVTGTLRSVPKFVLGLAALLVAVQQLWGWISPLLKGAIR
jgi:hypothetical protein